MNQILDPHIPNDEETSIIKPKKKKFYKIQFTISGIVASISLIYFFFNFYHLKEKENLSKQLLNRYSASTLYSDTNSYNLTNANSANDDTPFVVGMIKIDKINLNYPILSYTDDQLLKISLCRFAGPLPNDIGNLCIAGHNYVDYKFFSRLHELELGDHIEIYDLSGQVVDYTIYEKYETQANDISCTNQETNYQRIITLLTCNNVNGKRLIIKAK